MFKEARNKSEYSGFINLVLEKKDNKTKKKNDFNLN